MKINKDLKRTLLVSASALMFLSVGGGAVNAITLVKVPDGNPSIEA